MLIYQKIITRQDLRANPEVLYVFGDNELRLGLGGQAKEMRGEKNAVGIRTKHKPSNHEPDFWSDDDWSVLIGKVDDDFRPLYLHLEKGGIVVWPLDGIGTGLADLARRAPKVLNHIFNCQDALEHIGDGCCGVRIREKDFA